MCFLVDFIDFSVIFAQFVLLFVISVSPNTAFRRFSHFATLMARRLEALFNLQLGAAPFHRRKPTTCTTFDVTAALK